MVGEREEKLEHVLERVSHNEASLSQADEPDEARMLQRMHSLDLADEVVVDILVFDHVTLEDLDSHGRRTRRPVPLASADHAKRAITEASSDFEITLPISKFIIKSHLFK